MKISFVVVSATLSLWPVSGFALGMTDPLTSWRDGTAMDRMQLATRFGKSFISLNESFTAGYFLKCIDDVSTYGNAKGAKIEDALKECLAARLRSNSDGEE